MNTDWENYLTPLTPWTAEEESTLCPPVPLVYRAFDFFPPEKTRVVILGQDPYHTPGKASGLAFGYNRDYHGTVDSSMASIIKAVKDTTGQQVKDLSLESWARQGILLLNTRLTTLEGKPLVHQDRWDVVIAPFLAKFSADFPAVKWLLWGREAQQYYANHVVNGQAISTSHPCKFSAHRGFLTCRQFAELDDIRWGE